MEKQILDMKSIVHEEMSKCHSGSDIRQLEIAAKAISSRERGTMSFSDCIEKIRKALSSVSFSV